MTVIDISVVMMSEWQDLSVVCFISNDKF